jgi:predicted O-methyltransferase YrrM
VALDIEYGSVTQEEADRLGQASVMPVDANVAAHAVDKHQPGDTEPWISRLVGDLIVARGARTVLETGCFTGATSMYIVDALHRLGGGEFIGCEIDAGRHQVLLGRLPEWRQRCPRVSIDFPNIDALQWVRGAPDRHYDIAFVDDCHEKPHVTKELTLLYPKMNEGGLILLHDVFGVCDLQSVVQQFGGYSIDLPRLGPAGGLGIIQVR